MKLMFLILFFLIGCNCFSQNTDSLRINQPVDSVVDYLVSLAMMNVRISTKENNALQSEFDYKRARSAWLNNIVIAGNLNEFSIKQGSSDPLKQSTVYPRYNIGLILPLGFFVNNSRQAKAYYYQYQASLDEIAIEKQNIRREVAIHYQNFILQKQLLALQREVIQDAKLLLVKQEEKFANGGITLEVYTSTSKIYINEQIKEVNIINDIRVEEAYLESLIGMNINDALQQFSVRK